MVLTKKLIFLFPLLLTSLLSGSSKLIPHQPRLHGPLPIVQPRSETDTTRTLQDSTMYPARGLILSLGVPGMGEWYAGARKKAALFIGVEVAAWAGWRSLMKDADRIEREYESFADEHWDLFQWWLRTPLLTTNYGDVVCEGTHHLDLFIHGQTATISSDSLCGGWIDGVEVVRNHEFYENVGKYDQFVAGWSDLYGEDGSQGWWEKEKTVGDSVEILVMTDLKNRYLNRREDANSKYRLAKYTITAIMFNHLFSAFDAFIETRRRSLSPKVESTVGLTFSPASYAGVGGLSLTLRW